MKYRAQYQCLKTKAILHNKKKTRKGEVLTINNHDIEVVRISRYLGAVIKNTNIENEKKSKLQF